MSGPTGIDYAAVAPALQMLGIRRRRWRGLFADLRIMERSALRAMYPPKPDGQ